MVDVKPEITVGSRWNGKRKGEEHRLVEVVEVDDHEGGYVRSRTLIAGSQWNDHGPRGPRAPMRATTTRTRKSLWHKSFRLAEEGGE